MTYWETYWVTRKSLDPKAKTNFPLNFSTLLLPASCRTSSVIRIRQQTMRSMIRREALAAALLFLVAAANGFISGNRFNGAIKQVARSPSTTLRMNKTPLTYNGKRVEVAPGSSLMAATKKLGMKVKTSCKKGDCGTCTINVGGKSMRACVGKVPPAPKLKSLIEKGIPVR